MIALLMLAAFPASADGPVLHEYIAPQPAEDLLLQATTLDGALPLAIETRSGVVPAPSTSASGIASLPSGGVAPQGWFDDR